MCEGAQPELPSKAVGIELFEVTTMLVMLQARLLSFCGDEGGYDAAMMSAETDSLQATG